MHAVSPQTLPTPWYSPVFSVIQLEAALSPARQWVTCCTEKTPFCQEAQSISSIRGESDVKKCFVAGSSVYRSPTSHSHSPGGEKGLSVQLWALIPHYRGKAGFPPSGLVLVRTQDYLTHKACISQPSEIMRWATESNSSNENARRARLLCLSALTLMPLPGFCSALCHSCGVSFSLIPFLQGSPPPSTLKVLLDVRKSFRSLIVFGLLSLQKPRL